MSSFGSTNSSCSTTIEDDNVISNIQSNVQRRGRKRCNPLKTRLKYPNKNLPSEATISDIATSHRKSNEKTFDTSNTFQNYVRKEFESSNVYQLHGTNCDPEVFLIPVNDRRSGSFFDRVVSPNKVINFIAQHMKVYYDLSNDHDAFSSKRMAMDDNMWDNLAYIIPLLCRQMNQVLQSETIVVKVEPDCLIFGDVHGNLNDIHHIYTHCIINPRYAKYRFIFLGDYIDRGPKPIEILCFLFALKLSDPNRFILLRGNHEVLRVNRKYGFQALCEHIFEDTFLRYPIIGKLAFESFNRTFTYLPLAAIVRGTGNHSLFCCHGGIPNQKLKSDGHHRSPWTISELNALTNQYHPSLLEPTKHEGKGYRALNEILWNDPIPIRVRNKKRFINKLFYCNKKRGGHCSYFSESALTDFLDTNHLTMLIRGHQYRHCKKSGFHYDFDNRMLTVFSSSNYCGQRNTTGYVAITGSECNVMARVLRQSDESAIYSDFNILKVTINSKTKEIEEILY